MKMRKFLTVLQCGFLGACTYSSSPSAPHLSSGTSSPSKTNASLATSGSHAAGSPSSVSPSAAVKRATPAAAPSECEVSFLPQKNMRIERVRLHTQPTQELAVELAISPKQRQIGMMCRPQMPDDTGMLFLFAKEKTQRFWMKNTLLPLDMVFIDRDEIVVGIVENARPLDLRSRGVSLPSQFVLELIGGEARRRGLSVGHRVEFLFDRAAIDL